MTTGNINGIAHPTILGNLNRLDNPEITVKRDLVVGRIPGEKRLENGTFPPDGFDGNDCPVSFTFYLNKIWKSNEKVQLDVGIEGILKNGGDGITVFGLIVPKQRKILQANNDIGCMYVAARFWLPSREGFIFMNKTFFSVLERCVNENRKL